MYKSGFVTILGRTNVGKSTLLNSLVESKVSITTNKVQTTRNVIRGIKTTPEYQMVFIDTPGIHKPKHKLGNNLNKMAFNSVRNDIDVILLVVEPDEKIGRGDEFISKYLNEKNIDSPVILVINKMDTVKKEEILNVMAKFSKLYNFSEIIPVSALNSENTNELLSNIVKYLPEGPQYYDPEQDSDYSEKFIFSELIREKVFIETKEEIPHSTAVYIDEIEKKKDLYKIYATIVIERDSQKKIVIGKGGSTLKNIGMKSRKEIEFLYGIRVFLDLHVKVKKNWRQKEIELHNFGYDLNSNE